MITKSGTQLEFYFRTGEYDRRVLEGTEREFEVSEIIRHPDYNPNTLNNDIALIKLKAPIMMDKYRSPVCLPSNPPKVGSTCYITGNTKFSTGRSFDKNTLWECM